MTYICSTQLLAPLLLIQISSSKQNKKQSENQKGYYQKHNSKGYKAVAKDLEIPVSSVHNVIKKFHSEKTV